jgi:hypothetical protein
MAVVKVPKGVTDLTTYGADTDTLQFIEGNQTITAGLNKTTLTEGFTNIYVAETFTGSIGSGAGALRCDVDAGAPGVFKYHAGGGACYYTPEGDNSLCELLEIISAGTFYLVGSGTVTDCNIARGNLVIPDGTIVTNLYQSGGRTTQGYNGTANTVLWVGGGQFNSQRSCTTGNIHGAEAIFKREDSSATVGTATTLNIGKGYTKWALGNITTVNLLHPDAYLDLSEVPNDITITTLNGYGQALAKSRLSSKLATVTISTTNTLVGNSDYWKGGFGTGGGVGFGI